MELNQVKEFLNSKKNGQFIRVKMTTDLSQKVKAALKPEGNIIVKETEITVRTGCQYTNLKTVREKLRSENKDISDVKPITWAHPLEGYNNSLLESNSTPGKYYIRLYTVKNNIPKVEYRLNNNNISKRELQELNLLIPSYWNRGSSDTNTAIMIVGIDNITEMM